MKNIDIIGVSINLGANRLGVEDGPRILLSEIGTKTVFTKHQKFCRVKPILSCPSFKSIQEQDPFIKNKNELFESLVKIDKLVSQSLEERVFPLVLGGDHSLSWGSISSVCHHYKDVGCIYIDAHGDLNPAEYSPSHNAHGMHMAYLMHMVDEKDIPEFQMGRLKPEHVFYLGVRSLDKEELSLVERFNLNVFSSSDIKSHGIKEITRQFLSKISATGLEQFHLSLDIDALDPRVAPGTGVPERDGMSLEDLKYFLRNLFSFANIVSMDFVEFNPRLDKGRQTLDVCLDLLGLVDEMLD